MINDKNPFYLDRSLKKDYDDKWEYLLSIAFIDAEEVAFNITFQKIELSNRIKDLFPDLVFRGKDVNRFYGTGKTLRFKLTDRLKRFIKSKSYNDWYNFELEDISFYKDGKEFFCTITHEDYVILQMDENLRNDLNNKGFSFEPFPFEDS
jgi:hypothetical protein